MELQEKNAFEIYWPLALEVNEFLKSNNLFHTVRLLDTSE